MPRAPGRGASSFLGCGFATRGIYCTCPRNRISNLVDTGFWASDFLSRADRQSLCPLAKADINLLYSSLLSRAGASGVNPPSDGGRLLFSAFGLLVRIAPWAQLALGGVRFALPVSHS